MATKPEATVETDNDFLDELFGDESDLNDFFVDKDSGSFTVGKPAIRPKAQDDTAEADDASDEVADSADSAAADNKDAESAIAKRVATLESSVTQLVNLLKEQVTQRQAPVEDDIDGDEDEFDFKPSSIRKLIKEEIKGALKPIEQSQIAQQQREAITADFQKVSALYGEDFQRLSPVIQELAVQRLQSDPTATSVFEDAYKLAKSFEKVYKPAKSDSTTQPKSETKPKNFGDANTLKAKVKSLETQQSVNRTGGKRPVRINSIEDAFDETLEELFGAGFDN